MTKHDRIEADTRTVTGQRDLYWEIGGYIRNEQTGIEYAVSRDGRLRVALNVPLASCCDQPVELCTCLAPVMKLSETKVAA